MARRKTRWWLRVPPAVATALVAGLVVMWLRGPYYVVAPAPVQNLSGNVGVDAAGTSPLNGDVYLTGVRLARVGPLAIPKLLLDPSVDVRRGTPRATDQAQPSAGGEMETSKHAALRAATMCLGLGDDTVAARIRTGKIAGPSGGLAFALAIVDLLEPGDLLAGRAIAATGTITPDGRVGPVGGIRHKAAAVSDVDAEVLLVPASQRAQAQREAPAVEVVGVHDLDDAICALAGTGCR